MRILPPIPILFRRARQAVDIEGVALRRGDWILLSQYMTHHMPDLFPSPNRFMPQRWFSATPGPYEYFPFGAGAHSCIGYTLSMSVLKVSLATILQRFRFALIPQTQVDRTVRITLNPRHGMPMILHPQDGRFESVPVQGQIHEMVDLPAPHVVGDRSRNRNYHRKEAA